MGFKPRRKLTCPTKAITNLLYKRYGAQMGVDTVSGSTAYVT